MPATVRPRASARTDSIRLFSLKRNSSVREVSPSLSVALAEVSSLAHDLLTVRDADRIAVLDRGRLAELGAHDELLAAGGLYARLWELHGTAGEPVASVPLEAVA